MIGPDDLDALDRHDSLAPFRDRFALPKGVIYLDGNSLGPLPRATPGRLAEVATREWGDGLIRSWNDAGWIGLPSRVGDKVGRLLGAAPGTVLVADSTTLNVVKAVAAALALRPGRRVLLAEAGSFPTDLYAAASLVALQGSRHELRLVDADSIETAIGPEVAALLLSHVDYRTGRRFDLSAVTASAHAAGALTIWDLAHSAGAMPIGLDASGADVAVGCGYKFLNGGPGAPAFIYVAPALLPLVRFPLAGWLGHAAPFGFEPDYRPAPGIAAAQLGTPPVLGLAALEVGVDLALEAPLEAVRAKSERMADFFMALVEQECAGAGLAIVTPRVAAKRGSQVSLSHPQAWPVMQALIARGVIGDVRQPDILRFGLTPLTLRYAELGRAVHQLGSILRTGVWRAPEFQVRRAVT